MHLGLTWAIFILVQPTASEDLWVNSCNHSSGLEQFQESCPLPGNCPRAFPLRLAWAHGNTNRSGEQEAWPESRQIWQFFSLWNSPGSHNLWFPSRSSASLNIPPTLPSLGTFKGRACQTTAADAYTQHWASSLNIANKNSFARSPTECNSLSKREQNCTVSVQFHTVKFCEHRITFRL